METVNVISLSSLSDFNLENWTKDFSKVAVRFNMQDDFELPPISVTYLPRRFTSVFRVGRVLSKLRLTFSAASGILISKGKREIQRNAMYLTFDQAECLADHYASEILKSFNKAKKSKAAICEDDFALYQAFNYEINWNANSLNEIELDKKSILKWFWACISDRLGESNQLVARFFREKIYEISKRHNRLISKFSCISFDVGLLLVHIRPHQFHVFPNEDNSSNTTFCIAS